MAEKILSGDRDEGVTDEGDAVESPREKMLSFGLLSGFEKLGGKLQGVRPL